MKAYAKRCQRVSAAWRRVRWSFPPTRRERRAQAHAQRQQAAREIASPE